MFFNKNYFKFASLFARMVELVDTLVSGTSARKGVQVRVLFRVQKIKKEFEIKQDCLYLRPEKMPRW